MLKGILSISGQGGLFKLIAEAKNSIIVESITTGKRMPAHSTAKISALEDIAIFTDEGDVNLKVVLKNIFDLENGGEAISHKSSGDELKKYFEKVLPDYDKDRVYVSDIKKVLMWYNTLLENELLNFEEEVEESTDEISEEPTGDAEGEKTSE